MKKVLLLAALFLGTTVMVNAQTDPKAAPAKEVKATKAKKAKVEKKEATPAAAPVAKAKK